MCGSIFGFQRLTRWPKWASDSPTRIVAEARCLIKQLFALPEFAPFESRALGGFGDGRGGKGRVGYSLEPRGQRVGYFALHRDVLDEALEDLTGTIRAQRAAGQGGADGVRHAAG